MTFQTLLVVLVPLVLVTWLSISPRLPAKGFVTRNVPESFTVLSTEDVSRLKPFTFYASAAYCQPSSQILSWDCGGQLYPCSTGNIHWLLFFNSRRKLSRLHFIPSQPEVTGQIVQYWYVGFDPTISVRTRVRLFAWSQDWCSSSRSSSATKERTQRKC